MSNSENLSDKPIRLVILGGSSTGKTTLVSRLTVNIAHEVHYPTRKQNNWLFAFKPSTLVSRTLLDENSHERMLLRSQNIEPIFQSPQVNSHILLSPLVYQSFLNDWKHVKNLASNGSKITESTTMKASNQYYAYTPSAGAQTKSYNTRTNSDTNIINSLKNSDNSTSIKLPSSYDPPDYTPVTIDIIDTPGFNPDMVVPFLEVSLFRNLDKSVLKGLASQPRVPVSTTSLLVASGASELNGKVDGYIFVYSAVPELNHDVNPPDYAADSKNESTIEAISSNESSEMKFTPGSNKPVASAENTANDSDTNETKCEYTINTGIRKPVHRDSTSSVTSTSSSRKNSWSTYQGLQDGGFSLLSIIRNCILDAWTEFRNYQKRWAEGQEGDVYSLMYSLKHVWKSENERNNKLRQLRSFQTELDSIGLNPESPDSPPPMMIVATHANDPLSSPVLIEWGKDQAMQWNCGFVALDSAEDYNVDEAMSLMVREIVEKERLTKRHHSKGKKTDVLKKIIKT